MQKITLLPVFLVSLAFSLLCSSMAQADSIEFNYAPERIVADGTHTVVVDYQADADRDLVVSLFDASWNYYGETKLSVTAGSGEAELAFSAINNPSSGTVYRFKSELRPVGASWQEATATALFEQVEVAQTLYNWAGIIENPSPTQQAQSYAFEVAYSADMAVSVHVDLFDANYTYLGGDAAQVLRGSGSVVLTVDLNTLPAVGSDYRVKADIRPVGGDWTDALFVEELDNFTITALIDDAVSLEAFPTELPSASQYTFSYQYEAASERKIVLDLFTQDWSYIQGTEILVEAGKGSGELTIELAQALIAGDYRVKLYSAPVGGSWQDAIVESIADFNVAPQFSDSISFIEPPLSVVQAESYALTVGYSAADQRTLSLEMFDTNWTWLGIGTVDVEAGEGNISLTVKPNALTNVGSGYKWKVMSYPRGGNYETQVAQAFVEEVSVTAKEIDWNYRLNGPAPGSIYKEYYRSNTGNEWRITDPTPGADGAYNFLPNPILDLTVDDLARATRAEVIIDHWGGHPKTTDRKFRINGGEWYAMNLPDNIPEGQDGEQYFFQYTDTVEIPVWALKEGVNDFEGICDTTDIGPYNWGQFGWYSIKVRVYYDDAKPHSSASLALKQGDAIEDSSSAPISFTNVDEQVDLIEAFAIYTGVDTNGIGHFDTLHHHQSGDGFGGIGKAYADNEWTASWDTSWIPDQSKGGITIIPRVRNADGIWHVLPATQNLSLTRTTRSVKMYTPYNIWPWHGPTSGVNKQNEFFIADTHPVEDITAAKVHLRTWNGYDINGEPRMRLNDGEWKQGAIGYDHYFQQRFYDWTPSQFASLKQGENSIHFESTWVDTKPHHSLEILWPGPVMLVEYPVAVE